MDEDKDLKTKRLKIYLAPLLPIDPSLISKLDKNAIDINKSQVFIHVDEIYRELFSYILLEKGKKIEKKPSYKVVTLDDLVGHHFNKNESMKPYCSPEILFVVHASGYTGNPIYGPVFDKILEERKVLNRITYFFFRGDVRGLKSLKLKSGYNLVDYNAPDPKSIKRVNGGLL